MKTLRIALLLPVLSAFVAGPEVATAASPQKADNDKLVAKWEVTEAENTALVGSTLEFTGPGTLIITLKLPGDIEFPLVGKYEVSGTDLKVTMKGPNNQEKTDTNKVEELSDTELVLKDGSGKVTKYKKSK